MYQALYRQYRPKTFKELLGQDHVTTTLSHQVEKGNIGHAYLFSGTRGTGKTSAAKILSRAVNCLNPDGGNPCNQCSSCLGILDESIMDVMEMDAASNNSVDDIRDLRDKVIYPPSRTKYKVYIIDEVHMLSKGAFNALLKTLEEPPKHLIFILATTEPERLPQTILSRCQRFDFKRITAKDIVKNMKNISSKIGLEIEEEALKIIARNSDGAMRDALSLLDQCISFNTGVITYEDAINILGIANKDLIFNMVDDIRNLDLGKSLLAVDQIIQDGKDIHQFIKDIINHFRNLMIVKTTNNPEEIMEVEDIELYKEQSKKMELTYILSSLDILTDTEAQAKWSTQPRIILEMGIIKLVNLEEVLSLEERVKNLEMGLKPVAHPEKQVDPVVTKLPIRRNIIDNKVVEKKELIKEVRKEEAKVESEGFKELDINIIKEEWDKVMQGIKSMRINIYALIMEGELVSFENDLLVIEYEEGFEFHKDAIDAPRNKEFVEEIVGKYFNREIKLSFRMVSSLEKHESKDKNKDNAIKQVLDIFGEDIVEIN